MKLLGYPQLGCERFACVRTESELDSTSGHILCFERDCESLLLRCVAAGVKTALWTRSTVDVLFGMNYGVTYLLTPLDCAPQNLTEWQGILHTYLSDCLLVREIHGSDSELLDSLRLGLDAVVLCSAIIPKF